MSWEFVFNTNLFSEGGDTMNKKPDLAKRTGIIIKANKERHQFKDEDEIVFHIKPQDVKKRVEDFPEMDFEDLKEALLAGLAQPPPFLGIDIEEEPKSKKPTILVVGIDPANIADFGTVVSMHRNGAHPDVIIIDDVDFIPPDMTKVKKDFDIFINACENELMAMAQIPNIIKQFSVPIKSPPLELPPPKKKEKNWKNDKYFRRKD
jgi:hypothetical protein